MSLKIAQDFFNRPTLDVAQNLLGQSLVFGDYRGVITETEAYIGKDDPACHATKGQTPRTRVMFGPPGYSYIYLIYGMYHCLNIVTEQEGFPAAVLIRGLYLMEAPFTHLNGPGKLCRHLRLTKDHNNINICTSENFYLCHSGISPPFLTTSRIGIKVGTDRLWRFVVQEKDLKKIF